MNTGTSNHCRLTTKGHRGVGMKRLNVHFFLIYTTEVLNDESRAVE